MVMTAAIQSGMKVYIFSGQAATRAAFLKYAKSPHLKAIYYDGDGADALGYATGIMDGTGNIITSTDMKQFDWTNVTFIGLICHGYTEPLLSSITKNAKVQAYVSGITTLHQHDENDIDVEKCASNMMIDLIKNGSSIKDSYQRNILECDTGDHGGDGKDEWGLYQRPGSPDQLQMPQMKYTYVTDFLNDFGPFIVAGDNAEHKPSDVIKSTSNVIRILFMNWKGTGMRPMLIYDLTRNTLLNPEAWNNIEGMKYSSGMFTLPDALTPTAGSSKTLQQFQNAGKARFQRAQ